MTEKIYDITCECDGWACRSGGNLLGTFPSWQLAMGATRAAAAKDKRNGLTPIIRYQDLKGTMQTLDFDDEGASQPPVHPDASRLRNIDHLAPGQRPH
jgi:hypothetical protein